MMRALSFLAALFFSVSANAQWTQVVSDNFTRANTSPGIAGSTTGVGNNWTDVAGGIWNINTNNLLGTTTNTTGYATQFLTRPIGETAVGSRIVDFWTQGSSTGSDAVAPILRYQTGGTYYMCQVSQATSMAFIYAITAGVGSAPIVGPTAVALVSGHSISADFYASGTSPTTVNCKVTDTTTSTVLATLNTTDSTVGLQMTGQQGFVLWSGGGSTSVRFTQATTYTGSPAVPSIAISPTSVTGGTTGNVIAVTGTNTSFAGTPFTASAGLGPLITAQSVSSGTAGSITINPGSQGYGTVTITDTGSGATATLTVNTPSLGAFNHGWVGASIVAGTNGAPVTAANTYLTGLGYSVTSTNEAVSGSGTGDWIAGSTNLNAALSAFSGAGTTIVNVGGDLDTNDVRPPNSLTAAAHHTNMISLVNTLVSHGYKVILHKPVFTCPNAYISPNQWPNDPNGLYLQYWTLDTQLANGVTVFQGDTGGYQYSSVNPTTFLAADCVHPANSTQNNLLGGTFWGPAIAQRFGNYVPASPWAHY